MADEKEIQEAKDKHNASLARLRTLRTDVDFRMGEVVNRYYEYPSDLIYEREERGRMIEDLRSLERRIDETINDLE